MPYPYRSLYEWLDDEEKLGNVLRVREPIKCGDYTNLVDIGFDKFRKTNLLKEVNAEKWADIALIDPSIKTSPVRMKRENLLELINWILKQKSGHVFKSNFLNMDTGIGGI